MAGDTIAAIATAPGYGGVGIVRVSGPRARAIGERIGGEPLTPGVVQYRRFRDREGRELDSGLLLFFAGPRSFTGEDVVEFQGHGGPVVLQMLLDETLHAGARLARPGEFTERAYLNGKMDLAQAEAVADLIAGASEAAVRGASRSLSGAFSRRVHRVDALVVDLRVFVEAAMDFPEEEMDLLADGQVAGRLEEIREALERLKADCAQGVKLRDGVSLALMGLPNVGKSSLLNRLAGESRAIVTDIPGTTRDLVRADLVLEGLPVEVVDTAGLREAADAVEAEGVRRALEEAAGADIVLLVSDMKSTERSFEDEAHLRKWLKHLEAARILRVLNKVDLAPDPREARARARAEGLLGVSAETGEGLGELREAILRKAGYAPQGNRFTARKRHLLAMEEALAGTARALALARESLPGELVAEELRAVHEALGSIVGEMSSDELLGEIFSRFCIGK